MTDPLNMAEQPRHLVPSQLIHDLRTPLNQILGYSEMLTDQARELGHEGIAKDLERVRGAGLRLLDLVINNFDGTTTTMPQLESQRASEARTAALTADPLLIETGSIESKGSLLVVDDEEGNRDVLSRLLERQGYTVTTAENGQRALEMLGEDTYDLVLLDIMMDGLDGYEVLQRIKGDDRFRHVPVIMISAPSEMESVAGCIEMGAEDYLQKPFNSTLLRARIGASLEKKRGHDREIQFFQQLQANYSRLQALEGLRDDLTHMIIHDLRTPLTSVVAAIQTLDVVGEVNLAQREVMAIAVTGADTLLEMINTLLDVEKLESGAMELDYSLLSVPELIATAVAQVTPIIEEKNLNLGLEIPPGIPWIQGDENKLQRVLVNLLGNAIKFTPISGSVTIRVQEHTEPGAVEFMIEDTGQGIPVEAFERIFEKFGQVESRKTGQARSTGLGLTFCKLAVEAHRGVIGVDSVPGQGSTFSFMIPLSPPVAPE